MELNQIAINTVSTAKAPLPEMLRAYAQAGFKNVETDLTLLKKWMSEGNDLKALKALFAETGMRCIGGFETEIHSFKSEEELRANRKLTLENANLLDALGGGVLVVGTDTSPVKDLAALKKIGTRLRSLIEEFPASVSIAVEFNWSGIVKSIGSAAVVADAAGHPRVGILFDAAHYYCTPSKLEHLNGHVASRILHVHVDDMRDKPGDISDCNMDRVLPGEGCLDLNAIIGRLEENGYRGFYSIEIFNRDLWALSFGEAAKRCFDAMRKLCQQMRASRVPEECGSSRR